MVTTPSVITLKTTKLLALVAGPSLVAFASTGYLIWRGFRDYKLHKQVKLSRQEIAGMKLQIAELRESFS